MNPRLLAVLIGISALPATAVAAGNPEAGRAKAWTCMGCHGVPGYANNTPTYHVPKLGGQHAEYLATALRAYRAKERAHATMQAQAATLTDQDIDDLAAYFATVKSD